MSVPRYKYSCMFGHIVKGSAADYIMPVVPTVVALTPVYLSRSRRGHIQRDCGVWAAFT